MSTISSNTITSYQTILSIAIPVIFANFLLPLQSVIDTAVVGNFSHSYYLAGMAIAVQVITIITVSFNFLQYTTSGLSAQAYGALEHNSVNTNHYQRDLLPILQRAFAIALIVASGILLCREYIITYLLQLFYAGDESQSVAKQYLHIRIWSIIPELINYIFIGFFAGIGKTNRIFIQQAVITVTNIGVTLILVYGFSLQVAGVAIGTLVAQWLGCLVALACFAQLIQVNIVQLFSLKKAITEIDNLKKVCTLNMNVFTRSLLLVLSFAWITRLSAHESELVVATNAILLQILIVSSYVLDGVAVSAESLTGRSLGNRDWANFRIVLKKTALCSYGLALVLSLTWISLFTPYLTIMTTLDDVKTLAYSYQWYAVLLPVIGVGAYWIDGVLFGMANGRLILKSSLFVSMIFFPMSYLLAHNFSVTGIWLSIWLLLLLRFVVAGFGVYNYHRRTTKNLKSIQV